MSEYTLLLDGAVVAEVQEAVINETENPPTFALRAEALKQAGHYQLRRNSDDRTVPIIITGFYMNISIRFWTGIILVQ